MANPIKVIKGLLGAEEDLGDFIANGPADGLPGHVRDKFRHRCNEFANLPGWAQALSGVAGGSIGRFCKPYWDDNGWDGPQKEDVPPGGQCAGTIYRIRGTYTPTCGMFIGTTRNWRSTADIAGPISGVVLENNGDSWAVQGASATSQCIDTTGFVGLGNAPRPGVTCGQLADDRFVTNVKPTITSFEAISGPDDCGDLPAPIVPGPNPPPDPGPLPGPEPTENPDPENPIPFLPIPPFEDPVYGPQPITGPSDSPPSSAPGTGDGLPGDPDAIGDEAGEVNGGEPGEDILFGEPPEGKVWVGCIVQATVDLRVGNIAGTAPNSTVWPTVVGNCSLKYGSYYSSSIPVRSKFTELFRRNNALIVTGVFLHALPGNSLKVFPISAETCPDNPCSET